MESFFLKNKALIRSAYFFWASSQMAQLTLVVYSTKILNGENIFDLMSD